MKVFRKMTQTQISNLLILFMREAVQSHKFVSIVSNYLKLREAYKRIDSLINSNEELNSEKLFSDRKTLKQKQKKCFSAMYYSLAECTGVCIPTVSKKPKKPEVLPQQYLKNVRVGKSRKYVLVDVGEDCRAKVGLNNEGNNELVIKSRKELLFHADGVAGTIVAIPEESSPECIQFAAGLAFVKSKSFKFNLLSRSIVYAKAENVKAFRRNGKFIFNFIKYKSIKGSNLKFSVQDECIKFGEKGEYTFTNKPVPSDKMPYAIVNRIANYTKTK